MRLVAAGDVVEVFALEVVGRRRAGTPSHHGLAALVPVLCGVVCELDTPLEYGDRTLPHKL